MGEVVADDVYMVSTAKRGSEVFVFYKDGVAISARFASLSTPVHQLLLLKAVLGRPLATLKSPTVLSALQGYIQSQRLPDVDQAAWVDRRCERMVWPERTELCIQTPTLFSAGLGPLKDKTWCGRSKEDLAGEVTFPGVDETTVVLSHPDSKQLGINPCPACLSALRFFVSGAHDGQ